MWWSSLRVVAEHGDRLAERRPDVVEVHAGRHHPDDHLKGVRLRNLDLLKADRINRLAEAILPDHPRRHRVRELARLDTRRS